MDKFGAMQAFVRVAEKGSFSAAAKERGIGQPAVSKLISALEDELGVELIHRSSRSISLTDAGRDFYGSAVRILDDYENVSSRIGRAHAAPKGLVRLSVQPTFARLHVVSKLSAFFERYPDLAVELGSSTERHPSRIIDDGFDIAIHSGDLPDSDLVVRRIGQTMEILVATPQYVARYGAPNAASELRNFPSIAYMQNGAVLPWSFGDTANIIQIVPRGALRTGDLEQLRMGVLEHLGIAQAPAWLFAAELREGTVVRLLSPLERTIPIMAVRPASRRVPTKVRILIDHLEACFALCFQFNPHVSDQQPKPMPLRGSKASH
ncbi:LysR family transcriptional regulator [Acidisarcina polymorpha]|nr:LysR family transcriptional regulator [Acidisarcina polymorpha]